MNSRTGSQRASDLKRHARRYARNDCSRSARDMSLRLPSIMPAAASSTLYCRIELDLMILHNNLDTYTKDGYMRKARK